MTKTAQTSAPNIDPSEMVSLGEKAAQLYSTGGLTLTEACVQVLGHRKLAAEQIRRVVEKANLRAFRDKYASMDATNRYVTFSGGPADPAQVIQSLAAHQGVSGTGAYNTGLDDYSLAPTQVKTSSVNASVVSRTLDGVFKDVLDLRSKLASALDDLTQQQEAAQWRVRESLSNLGASVKKAARDGATQGELLEAWSAIDTSAAKHVLRKVSHILPPGRAKVSGRSINPEHPLVVEFSVFIKEAKDALQLQDARRNVEQELVRVEDWLAKESNKAEAAKTVGKTVGHALKWIGQKSVSGAKKTVRFGGDVAEGVAGPGARGAGQAAATVGLAGAAYGGARAGKQKIDEFRYQHGLY